MHKEEIKPLVGNELKIIQRSNLYRFGLEAVLLANFVEEKDGQAADLGSGDGVIPLLLAYKKGFNVKAFELQRELVELSRRSVVLNKMEKQIDIKEMDIRLIPQKIPAASFDVVTANPPFFPAGTGRQNPNDGLAMARHEIHSSLLDFIQGAAHLLRPGGVFYLVHRPSRLVDICVLSRQNNLEPKRVCFVQPRLGWPANIVLLACKKGAKADLNFLPSLTVYQGEDYSEEIKEIFTKGSFA